MIPKEMIDAELEIIEDVETTKTYRLTDINIQGFTNELKALQQAIYKVLNTEKYEYPIYSFAYGIELESLIGKDPIYVQIELQRRVQECLLQDERITGIDNFQCTVTGDSLLCTFDVISIYGNITIMKEVNV
ncbi:DUF2634 domain-containing protein [Anaerocolumna sp.]|uniref:DUF2634 domain-containing protein n=1 Tax=Anaerocolumna sp. TaxID=2041569 RepID=UPI0028AE1F16|nr:DUF2634 domain-containing protein [Anaerocolumna sp.]